MSLESILWVLSPKPHIMVIGMITRRISKQRLEEEIAYAAFPPRGNQDPHLEEIANDDQAPANPLGLSYGDIRAAFLQVAQAITN